MFYVGYTNQSTNEKSVASILGQREYSPWHKPICIVSEVNLYTERQSFKKEDYKLERILSAFAIEC